ncbi:MAG: cytochrome c [Acidobacteria bacterium]|nr:cytochrome c [Acidobacteriota bacterium]
MRSRKILCLLCCIPLLGLMSCSTNTVRSGAESRADQFAIEEGGRLFGHYCAPCHGESGQGDGRYYASGLEPVPADLTGSELAKANSDENLVQDISQGSAGRGKSNLCPGWGATLPPTEITYLVRFIRHLQSESPKPAPDAPQ